jgi:hypothetical protein
MLDSHQLLEYLGVPAPEFFFSRPLIDVIAALLHIVLSATR